MSTRNTNDPQHWRDRAAQMRALAVKMAGSEAAILINDLAADYEKLSRASGGQGQWEKAAIERQTAVRASISARRSTCPQGLSSVGLTAGSD
jgi:hypothetical protein